MKNRNKRKKFIETNKHLKDVTSHVKFLPNPSEVKHFQQNFNSVFNDQRLQRICLNYTNHINTMIRNHGVASTIKFHKEVLRFTQQCCMNQGATFNQAGMPWTKTKHGWPYYLIKGIGKPMNRLMKDFRFRQGLLTICNFYKLIKAPVSYDISTITQGAPKSRSLTHFILEDNISDHFNNFIKRRSIDKFKGNDPDPIFVTPKAGANGPNAMGITSIKDAIACRDDALIVNLTKIALKVFTPEAFEEWKILLTSSLSFTPIPEGPYKNSRLHFLNEGGGKTRIICIADIWSQSVLRPIHDYLMSVLKRLPGDGTFSHSNIAKRVRKWTKTKRLASTDLTAATDRMPISLQEKVLSNLLGKELAALWRSLVVDRDVDNRGNKIRYAVGQPMGMLSSWPAMAITHHAIIDYSQKDLSKLRAVIGDDATIAYGLGAKRYRKNVIDLGMHFSLEKSITSNMSDNLSEIAKRLFVNGGEISPIPSEILIKSTGTLIGYLEFIRVFSEKYHHTDLGGFSDSEYQHILSKLFHNSNFRDDEDVHILLSFPILDNFPILPRIPPIKGVRKIWRNDIRNIKKRLITDFERFILETFNNRTNMQVLGLSDPHVFVESEQKEKFPMYEYFRLRNSKRLKLLIHRINTTYIDDEADGFAEGPMKDLNDILSFPSPLGEGVRSIYLSKRKLRLKNTHSLIQLFLAKFPFYRVPKPRK